MPIFRKAQLTRARRRQLRVGLAAILALGAAGAAHASTVTLNWTPALTIPSSATSSGQITASDATLPSVTNPSTYSATIPGTATTTYSLTANGTSVLPAPTLAGLAITNGTLAPFTTGMAVTSGMFTTSGSPLTTYTITLNGTGTGILPLVSFENDVIAVNSTIGNALKLFLTAAYPSSNEFLFDSTGTVTVTGTPTTLALSGSVGAEAVIGAWKVAAQPVPLPAAAWLLGSGVLGLAGLTRRRGLAAA